MTAPVVVAGSVVGYAVVGGFLEADAADAETRSAERQVTELVTERGFPAEDLARARARLPRLAAHEIDYLGELVALCADEISARQEDRHDERTVERNGAARHGYDAIVGRSPVMEELYRLLDKVSDSEVTVLIQGENGTGKELVARAIHFNSVRKDRPFVVQNCSAFNDNLLDSELFGHRRGAFTGAIADKHGLFEIADGGTFFLDEIGDMTPALQVKLLRVLQEGTFLAVGDTTPRRVDVRIVAATNRDLRRMVDRGEFREDLFYRLEVVGVTTPPLRARREDIPLLVDHFMRKHARGGSNGPRLSKGCLDRMLEYRWPGNVRELENEIERLVVLAGGERTIGAELLSSRIRRGSAETSGTTDAPAGMPEAVTALQRGMIAETLRRYQGNKTRTAAELGISRRNLIRLVQKYGLEAGPRG